VAAPIGPMGALCIQRTLGGGLVAGLATGSGAATVHLLYGTVVAFSSSLITDVAAVYAPAFKIIAALLLFWFALRILRRTIALEAGRSMAHCVRAYRDVVLFGLANPITILLLLASTTGMTLSYSGWTALSFSLGVFAGSMGWWLVLSGAVCALRQRLDATLLRRTNQGAALALAAFGCLVLVQGVQALSSFGAHGRAVVSTTTGTLHSHEH
jgi:threonine/homoserine/homoserine lactone efflux protein